MKIYNYVCKNCGIDFESKIKSRLFCSVECSNRFAIKNKAKIIVKCLYCDSEFETIFYKKKFCNDKCRIKFNNEVFLSKDVEIKKEIKIIHKLYNEIDNNFQEIKIISEIVKRIII